MIRHGMGMIRLGMIRLEADPEREGDVRAAFAMIGWFENTDQIMGFYDPGLWRPCTPVSAGRFPGVINCGDCYGTELALEAIDPKSEALLECLWKMREETDLLELEGSTRMEVPDDPLHVIELWELGEQLGIDPWKELVEAGFPEELREAIGF